MSEKVLLDKIERLDRENRSLVDLNMSWLKQYKELEQQLQAKTKRVNELEEALNGIKSVASGKNVTLVAAEWLIKKIEQALEAKE